MKCPRCVQAIHRAAESCPHCGFSIVDADARFGGKETRLRCLTDHAGILRRGEREQVQAALEWISWRCPQIFVAVFTGALGDIANMRQFGFWLLNRCVFEGVPADLPNGSGVLITIDPESKAAGMVFGYLLDPFIEEVDTFECLSRGHAHWLEQRYAEGIVKTIRQLDAILCKRSRQVRRHPEHFQHTLCPAAIQGAAQRAMGRQVPSPPSPEIKEKQP